MLLASLVRNWLSPVDPRRNMDLMFVLAGRESRKLYGLELFRQRLAPRVLLSVGRFEIRSLSNLPLPGPVDLLGLADRIPPPQRHYFVQFERGKDLAEPIRPDRICTIAEM